MTDTIREIVIKNWIARASIITIANGYNTDIGKNVLRAVKKISEEECPVSDVWPGPETAEHLSGQIKCKMQMKVDGIAVFGKSDPSVVAEQILGDLKKCYLDPENDLTSPPSGWIRNPDYIDSIVYTGGGPGDSPDEGQITIGAFATFDVGYTTKLNDPCSQ